MITVKWAINNRCNLSCPFCFADTYFTENSFEDKLHIIDKMYKEGLYFIDFFGKEPLIDDTALRLCEYIQKKYPSTFNVSLITNGLTLDKYSDRIIDLPDIYYVTVSYDFGVTRKHTVDLSVLKYLKDNGLNTEITIDLQKKNIDKVFDFKWNRYATTLYINPIFSSVGNYTLSKEELIDFIQKYNGSESVTIKIPFQYGKIDVDTKCYLDTDYKCSAGKEHLFITADGRVFGCNMSAFAHKDKYGCDYLSTPLHDIQRICSCSTGRCCV